MKSYPSYIDGHEISCAKLPTTDRDTDAAMVSLQKLPLQISARGREKMPQVKEVTVNGLTINFVLGKNNEYWNGKKGLTEYLLSFKRNMKVSIR